jgi:hypothetical protein
MATNPYFRTSTAAAQNEQYLLEDLIVEIVKIHGIDVYYIPRTTDIDFNNLLGEQPDTSLIDAYPIEAYLINFDGYEGDNELIAKIGFIVQSSTNMVITARSFRRHVGIYSRPREGDLIFVPLLARIFEIKHADPDANFHQLGRKAAQPYYWELRLEQFKYAQENIVTGVDDIDIIGVLNSYRIRLQLGAGSGNYVIGEDVYQGANYLTANSTATVADWNPVNKILDIINVKGTMNVANVAGATSGSIYMVSSYDDKEDHVPDDMSGNAEIEDESDTIIDTTETNPLFS